MKKLLLLLTMAVGAINLTAKETKTTNYPEHMKWWRDARFGMFVHWGLPSLYGGEISWSRSSYGASRYDSLALRFNPVNFDADKWVAAAKNAGMKYIVLTTKHHDGFCLWNTKSTAHNIMNAPFGRDVCRELADAARKAGIKIGWYISVRDWSDPNCLNAEGNPIYAEKLKTQLKELLGNYGKIDLVWFDYDGWASPAQPNEIFALVKSLQPDIVVNNRVEALSPDESHAFVGKYSEYATPEQFVGSYGELPWESCANLAVSGQWAWRKNDAPASVDKSITQLMRTVGANGNLLLNVGPDSLGVIPESFATRLGEIGEWTSRNSAALYETTGGPLLPTPEYVSTRKGDTFYIILLNKKDAKISIPRALGSKIVSLSVCEPTETKTEVLLMPEGKKGYYIELPNEVLNTPVAVIKVVCSENIDNYPVVAPPSTSGSLAYGAKASASSSMGDVYMHNPSAAVDDNDITAWVIGRRSDIDLKKIYGTNLYFSDPKQVQQVYNDNATFNIELNSAEKVGRAVIKARKFYVPTYIESIRLEYKSGSKWITAAKATFSSPEDWKEPWTPTFSPVKAKEWRVVIDKGHGYFGISEFQLFP